MADIFLSHVEEDGQEAIAVAAGLERAGYSTWYYERDAVVGVSYLQQVVDSIGQSQAFVLIISTTSVASHQVDRELTHAYEKSKHLLPLLKDLTFSDFQRLKPDWKLALGPSVAEPLSSAVIDRVVDKVVRALERMGVSRTAAKTSQRESSNIFVRVRLGPEDLARTFRPLFASGQLECAYRVAVEGDAGRWLAATIVALTGGLFVNLRDVPREAFIEVQVTHRNRVWRSGFLEAATIYAQLDEH